MKEVKAVACDMNSDFQEAFLEKCPHLKIVFDHFHIIKNFNEKVVAPVRIAEQKRLMEAGDTEAAESLKHTKYILTSKRTTLQRKDQEAREGRIISKGSTLFKEEQRVRKEGYEAKYDALLEENKLGSSSFFRLHPEFSICTNLQSSSSPKEIRILLPSPYFMAFSITFCRTSTIRSFRCI